MSTLTEFDQHMERAAQLRNSTMQHESRSCYEAAFARAVDKQQRTQALKGLIDVGPTGGGFGVLAAIHCIVSCIAGAAIFFAFGFATIGNAYHSETVLVWPSIWISVAVIAQGLLVMYAFLCMSRLRKAVGVIDLRLRLLAEAKDL